LAFPEFACLVAAIVPNIIVDLGHCATFSVIGDLVGREIIVKLHKNSLPNALLLLPGYSGTRGPECFTRDYGAKWKASTTAQEVTEKFRQVLSDGEPVTLRDAFNRFIKKPRQPPMSERCESPGAKCTR